MPPLTASIPPGYLAASPSLPAWFAEPLATNQTMGIAPGMAWIIMEQLHRSARYDPFFYAGYNMPSYLGYGYFNTLLGTRLANVIYRNAHVGAPVEGGLVSAFYVRQA